MGGGGPVGGMTTVGEGGVVIDVYEELELL